MGQVIVGARHLTLSAAVAKATGQQLVWFLNSRPIGTVSLPASGQLAFETAADPGDWFTIVIRDWRQAHSVRQRDLRPVMNLGSLSRSSTAVESSSDRPSDRKRLDSFPQSC